MKTSVNMIRQMGNFNVTQRTKDSFFNATELLKQWNEYSGQKKEMKSFLRNESTKEFIKALESRLTEKGENCTTFISGRGRGNYSWMHSFMFMKFAMWLSSDFEVKVIEFVYDQLMAFRNDAGDNYIELSNAVQRLHGCDFRRMAKGLNWIVFNRHEKNLRQKATQEQLHDLNEVQKKLAFAVDMGYINTFDALINEMRRLWALKWNRGLFSK